MKRMAEGNEGTRDGAQLGRDMAGVVWGEKGAWVASLVGGQNVLNPGQVSKGGGGALAFSCLPAQPSKCVAQCPCLPLPPPQPLAG